MNTKKIADIALQQLDNVGFQLRAYGITDRVNRHDLIALAMTGQTRLKGELSRLELRVGLQQARVRQWRLQAAQRVDALATRLPAPIAEPVNRLRERVLAP